MSYMDCGTVGPCGIMVAWGGLHPEIDRPWLIMTMICKTNRV